MGTYFFRYRTDCRRAWIWRRRWNGGLDRESLLRRLSSVVHH